MSQEVTENLDDDKKHRQLLQSIISEQQTVLDRNLIIISAGVFTISNTFTTSLIELSTAISGWMLIASWAFFGFCILIAIGSQFISQIWLSSHLEEWDKYLSGEIEQRPGDPKGNGIINLLNMAAFLLFFFGFVFHFSYIILNFSEVFS